MVYLLYILFFISCVLLIASVLLQPGKTDAGALFTSNISSTAFQPRGSQTILSKITIAAAVVFMLSALLLAMPALTGSISVLETVEDTPTESAPVVDANANVETNANVTTNGIVESNANVTSDANASTNINSLPSNVVVVTNANTTTYTANPLTNANAANATANTNVSANANR